MTIPFYLIYLLAIIISFSLTPLARLLAIHLKAIDQPSELKIHHHPIPRLGGLAVIISFVLVISLLTFFIRTIEITFFKVIKGLLYGTLLVFLVGFLDDLYQLTATPKLIIEICAAVILWYYGGRITLITNPFGGELKLGMLALPVTILWLVGLTNAMNLIDGLDGLCAGITYFASSTLFLISLKTGDWLIAILSITLAGSVLGFIPYNFPPAKIFLGDSGSLSVGFILASIAIISASYKAPVTLTLLVPIVTLGVPILDTLLAIFRRLGHKKSPFKGDTEHLHHRLLRLGFTQRQIVLFIYLICIYLGITAYIVTVIRREYAILILIILGLGSLFAIEILRIIERKISSFTRRNCYDSEKKE